MRPLPRLLSFELTWTDAAFDAIHPDPAPRGSEERERAALPHGIKHMHPARFFDDLLAEIPLEQSLGLRVALWIVALAPFFTIRRLATIASLGPEDRRRVLERLLASPIYAVRQLVTGLKAMAALLYAKSPAVRSAMMAPYASKVVPLRLVKKTEGSHEHAAE
jgi:hypothetical protein